MIPILIILFLIFMFSLMLHPPWPEFTTIIGAAFFALVIVKLFAG